MYTMNHRQLQRYVPDHLKKKGHTAGILTIDKLAVVRIDMWGKALSD